MVHNEHPITVSVYPELQCTLGLRNAYKILIGNPRGRLACAIIWPLHVWDQLSYAFPLPSGKQGLIFLQDLPDHRCLVICTNFTFPGPCIVIHIREKNQRDAHFC